MLLVDEIGKRLTLVCIARAHAYVAHVSCLYNIVQGLHLKANTKLLTFGDMRNRIAYGFFYGGSVIKAVAYKEI